MSELSWYLNGKISRHVTCDHPRIAYEKQMYIETKKSFDELMYLNDSGVEIDHETKKRIVEDYINAKYALEFFTGMKFDSVF